MTLKLVDNPKMKKNETPDLPNTSKSIFDYLPDSLIYLLASPYLAGSESDQAINEALDIYKTHGFSGTLDILGEDCVNEIDCDNAVAEYKSLIDKVNLTNKNYPDEQSKLTISFKPSMFMTGIPVAKTNKIKDLASSKAYERIKQVVDYGFKKNVNLTLEAEDHKWADFHLDTYFSLLNSGYTNLGTVLQTRLKRTFNDIQRFNDKSRVRLVIGIYDEPSSVAYTDKAIMKDLLIKYAKILFDKGSYVEFASHDTQTQTRFFKEIIVSDKITSDRYETQYLKGVPRLNWQKNLQSGVFLRNNFKNTDLSSQKSLVRLYLPYGKPNVASAYCKRRLAGNPNMVSYGIKNILGIN